MSHWSRRPAAHAGPTGIREPGEARAARGRVPCGPAHRLATMSALSRDDVAHLAGLARIDLSDAELDRMVGELGVILESVAKVQEAAPRTSSRCRTRCR